MSSNENNETENYTSNNSQILYDDSKDIASSSHRTKIYTHDRNDNMDSADSRYSCKSDSLSINSFDIDLDSDYSDENEEHGGYGGYGGFQFLNRDPKNYPELDFKSIMPNIKSQKDITGMMMGCLLYQYMFDRRTTPWEYADWEGDTLTNFEIDPYCIDRVYYIDHEDDQVCQRKWEISCRMNIENIEYFVTMCASCDYTGFDCQGGGIINITKRPQFFINNFVRNNAAETFKSLVDDGYNIHEPVKYDKHKPVLWRSVPMLKFLCHISIEVHKEQLKHYKEVLPNVLADSVEDYIGVRYWQNKCGFGDYSDEEQCGFGDYSDEEQCEFGDYSDEEQ